MDRQKKWSEREASEATLLELTGLTEEDLAAVDMTWGELWAIGDDYEKRKVEDDYEGAAKQLSDVLSKDEHGVEIPEVHFASHRIKETPGLLEKIVRKRKAYGQDINIDNYVYEIEDLIGIRLIHVFRDEYLPIHRHIHDTFGDHLVSGVSVKLRRGDDASAVDDLKSVYGNHVTCEEGEAYRSIHCVVDPIEVFRSRDVKGRTPRLEIQTRSIFEEGWSEINHRLVYKKDGAINPELATSSIILSQLVGASDEFGSLMYNLYRALKAENAPDGAGKAGSKGDDEDTVEPGRIEPISNEMIDALFDALF